MAAFVAAPARAQVLAGPSSAFMGSTQGMRAAVCRRAPRAAFAVEAATTRGKKAETLQRLQEKLGGADTTFVAGMNYKGMSVKDFENFRKKLPAGVELIVAKNTLVEKAVAGTKFEPLQAACKGPNAFLFSGEEVAPSIKAFNEMQKLLKKRNLEIEWTGGVMDGAFVTGKDIAKLENLPTKKQLIGRIAGAIKQVTTKVAVGTKQITTKVAYGVKEISEGKSDLIKA